MESRIRKTFEAHAQTESGDCGDTCTHRRCGVARKLLVVIWHVLSKAETDVHASEEDLAYKMLLLSWSLSQDVRLGLSYKEFAKYALMKLGVETDITRFVRRNVPRRLAARDEVLVRMTELGLSA